MMEDELRIQVFIDNDATVAGLAEYEFGSMKGCKSGILLTLGTGIGGGIVLNGEVYSGAHGVGSEIGHMIIGENFYNCNCGKNGCFETFASSTAIIRYTQKLIKDGNTDTIILQKVDGDLDKINAKIIFDSAKEGDRVAKMAVDRLVKYLVIGIFNIVNFMDPEVIALGGGISNAGEYLLNQVKEEFEKNKFFKTLPAANIVLAQFKNDAGILGAAMLGKHGIR
ncbi:ROK family protein [Caloramator sp. mosi_1]|uniref:ROK family protein n=1 Tax=Caloramator sp. mosi_1 TaxID=3023090 RepID=UPI002361E3EF|nr:ROK family protein [Caloramator sp. mosi_1]WDC85033.1 ROK family protein [Caloramator sp. mosi_1]